MRFISKLKRFMYGRYGIDDLYKFLFRIYICLFILGIFINNKILIYAQLVVFVFMIYRAFSRNIYKRQKENIKFLSIKRSFLKPFDSLKRNIRDRKYHVYKKCRHCKTILKLPLPSKRGIKHAKCPECHKRVTLFVLRKQKVEIIKNRKTKFKER